jgi:hypothetical protein
MAFVVEGVAGEAIERECGLIQPGSPVEWRPWLELELTLAEANLVLERARGVVFVGEEEIDLEGDEISAGFEVG